MDFRLELAHTAKFLLVLKKKKKEEKSCYVLLLTTQVVNTPANRITRGRTVMLFGVKVTGLVLSGTIGFTRKRKRKQNTTKHFCSLELLLTLNAEWSWYSFSHKRNQECQCGFLPSFIQHLLSPYYVQSTKTLTCRNNMAVFKKQMT